MSCELHLIVVWIAVRLATSVVATTSSTCEVVRSKTDRKISRNFATAKRPTRSKWTEWSEHPTQLNSTGSHNVRISQLISALKFVALSWVGRSDHCFSLCCCRLCRSSLCNCRHFIFFRTAVRAGLYL